MKVVKHANAAAFLARAKVWLERAEAENNLILGIAAFFESQSGRSNVSPYFLTVEENAMIVGVALMTPPRRLLLTRMPDEAVTMLADFMRAEQVPGVLGPTSEARLFADHWTKRTGQLRRPKMRERIHICSTVNLTNPAPGRLRPATKEDQPLLSEWCKQFCIDAQIADETVYFQTRLPYKIADQSLFVWDSDEIVSMAGLERNTAHGIAISWVYTPMQLRNKGYATSCVAALTQRMLDSGKHFCCLYADLSNPTSNGIYRKIGYQPVCDVQDWVFD